MAGPIHQLLAADHARLGALLARAGAGADGDVVDRDAFDEFRAGLLRHIAMEEKVLFVDARARRGGDALPIVRQLHADHAALASLLVPPPERARIEVIRAILVEHDPLEEESEGLYEQCEQLAGPDAAVLVARMLAIPPVRASQYLDDPRVHAHIARMLAARAHRPR